MYIIFFLYHNGKHYKVDKREVSFMIDAALTSTILAVTFYAGAFRWMD